MALVRLERSFACPRFHGYDWHESPSRETITDADGRFTLKPLAHRAPCLWGRYADTLDVLAPGYLPRLVKETDLYPGSEHGLRSDVFELTPVRYRSELRIAPRGSAGKSSARWESMVAASRTPEFHAIDGPGVFARTPGVVFDQVVALNFAPGRRSLRQPSVLAQDRRTGSLHVWGPRGDLVTSAVVPTADHRLIGGGDRPILLRDTVVSVPTELGAPLTGLGGPAWSTTPALFGGVLSAVASGRGILSLEAEGRRLVTYLLPHPGGPETFQAANNVALTDVVSALAVPAECVMYRRGGVAIVDRLSDGRSLFNLLQTGPSAWRAETLPLLSAIDGTITACAAGRDAVYLATADGRMIAVKIAQERKPNGYRPVARIVATARVPGGVSLRALAVGPQEIGGLWGMSAPEVIYGVAGDDAVYRFSADLKPDERIGSR